MRRDRRWLASALAVSMLALAGCTETLTEGEEDTNSQATIDQIPGTDAARVTLSATAIKHLDIQTSVVHDEPSFGKVVPYSAVLYDAEGDTWVFVNSSGRTFVREPVTVTRIAGDDALLSAGPENGTKVVTVGSAELYGTENEISE